METPSKASSLSRMALGALDANSHLIASSPRPSVKPSATPINAFSSPSKRGYHETPNKATYSLRDSITPLQAQTPRSPRRAMFGAMEQTPSRSGSGEKRKEAPTSAARNAEDAERAVKHGRLCQGPRGQGHSRQSSASGHGHGRTYSASDHGHKLFGEIATPVMTRKRDEVMNSSQETIANSSFNDEDMNDASQLSTISTPDLSGPSPTADAQRTPETLRQNANALKLRLQFAMYKLQTHQEHVPLRHVKVIERRPRFPGVVSSPRLPATRNASRDVSPVPLPPHNRATMDHSVTPSKSMDERVAVRVTAPGCGQGGRKQEGRADETGDEEGVRGDRYTASPARRPEMHVVGNGNSAGENAAVLGTPQRQDRLLSLVDAIEAAGKQNCARSI